MVVNGVLRTLWVGVGAVKNHMREAQARMIIPQRALSRAVKTHVRRFEQRLKFGGVKRKDYFCGIII